jgi:hypothetical protein
MDKGLQISAFQNFSFDFPPPGVTSPHNLPSGKVDMKTDVLNEANIQGRCDDLSAHVASNEHKSTAYQTERDAS